MISAIVLAAGLSKRMELGNKLLLEKNKITIIENTIREVKASKVDEIIVVLGKDSAIFKKKINDKTIVYVTNKDYSKGISTSIKKGLEKVNKKSIATIICLGDMPSIKTSTYNEIIDKFYNSKNQNIIPYFKSMQGNPVLFNKVYFEKLKEIKGDKGAKFLIKKYSKDFLKLQLTDQYILKDIDNAAQYYRYLDNE